MEIQNSLKILDWKCLGMTEVLKRLELIGNDGTTRKNYSKHFEYSDYLVQKKEKGIIIIPFYSNQLIIFSAIIPRNKNPISSNQYKIIPSINIIASPFHRIDSK